MIWRRGSSAAGAFCAVEAQLSTGATMNGLGATSAGARPTLPRSCEPCKKRKTKCDKVQPCSSCVLRSTVELCAVEDLDGATVGRPSGSSAAAVPPAPAPVLARKRKRGASDTVEQAESIIRRQIASLRAAAAALELTLPELEDGTEAPSEEVGSRGGAELPSDLMWEEVSGRIAAVPDLPNEGVILQPNRRSMDIGDYAGGPPKTSGSIRLAAVSERLPSMQDCGEMLRYFFDTLDEYVAMVHRPAVMSYWTRWIRGEAIPRSDAAIIVLLFALVGILVPRTSDEIKKFDRSPRSMHEDFFRLAHDIVERRDSHSLRQGRGRDVLERPDISFARVLVDGLATTYLVIAGQFDLTWYRLGSTVRRAETIQLFNEQHKRWEGLSDLAKESRRKLAWRLMVYDRWQTWHYLRGFAIIPSFYNVTHPSFDPPDAFDEATGMRKPDFPRPKIDPRARPALSEHLVEGVQFLRSYPSMSRIDRYDRAMQLDSSLEDTLQKSLEANGVTEDMIKNNRMLDTREDHKRFAAAVSTSSAVHYVRCTFMRPFLEDQEAPNNLRFASLWYARRIFEALPVVLRLANSPTEPWLWGYIASHLLAACSTFAVPLVTTPVAVTEAAVHTPASAGSRSSSSSHHTWPQEDLEYFSSKIMDTLDALDTLGVHNQPARMCHRLLEELCNSRQALAERYAERKRKRTRDGMDRKDDRPAAATIASAGPSSAPSKDGHDLSRLNFNGASKMAQLAPPPPFEQLQFSAAPAQPAAATSEWVANSVFLQNGTDASTALDSFLSAIDWAELTMGLDQPLSAAPSV